MAGQHSDDGNDGIKRLALAWLLVWIAFRAIRDIGVSDRDEVPPIPGRVARPRLRSVRRWLGYVMLPILAVVAAFLAAAHLLHINPAHDDPQHDVGLAFSVDGFATLQTYAGAMFEASLARVPGRQPEFESSIATDVAASASGCSRTVEVNGRIDLDPRWLLAVKNTREHQRLVLHETYSRTGPAFVIRAPHVGGTFAFGLSGLISDFHAQMEGLGIPVPVRTQAALGTNSPHITIVTGRVPDAEFGGRIKISEYFGDALDFRFRAPWVWARGFESCYLSLPRLVDDGYVSALPITRPDVGTSRPVGTASGQTLINVSNGAVDLQDTSPAPNTAGALRTWNCARGNGSPGILQPLPDCHATVVIAAPNQPADLQIRVIVLAAVLSGGLVGMGAGLRRILLRLD
jgi:hypothetical protein